MEIFAIGSVADVAKNLLVAVVLFGFGAFLVAVLVSEIRNRVWRRVQFLFAGGFARARIVTSVKTNRSERKPKYQLTVDFTTRYGLRLSGVVLAQTTSTTGRKGDVVHVLYPPLRPGAAVDANWPGIFARVVLGVPLLLGAGGYCMVLGAAGMVLAFR